MTDMSVLIKMEGKLVTIKKKTEGAADSYGDPAVTWTAEADQEWAWIQAATSAKSAEVLRTLAGDIDVSDYIGYLLPDTVIVSGDILEERDNRYEVGRILDIETFRVVSHKEAHLSLLQEGT